MSSFFSPSKNTHHRNSGMVSIFMGTLYWFFYGTAFVVGLVEILAGELETGVTRFMAVSIKTFVLCVMCCSSGWVYIWIFLWIVVCLIFKAP